jgi:hypothetical protein
MKRMTQKNSILSAKDQASLDHLIELSIVQKMNLAKWWTTPTQKTYQPRPTKCFNLFRFFLIHNMKRLTPRKSSLFAKDRASLDHLIELPIVGKMNQANDGQRLPQ